MLLALVQDTGGYFCVVMVSFSDTCIVQSIHFYMLRGASSCATQHKLWQDIGTNVVDLAWVLGYGSGVRSTKLPRCAFDIALQVFTQNQRHSLQMVSLVSLFWFYHDML